MMTTCKLDLIFVVIVYLNVNNTSAFRKLPQNEFVYRSHRYLVDMKNAAGDACGKCESLHNSSLVLISSKYEFLAVERALLHLRPLGLNPFLGIDKLEVKVDIEYTKLKASNNFRFGNMLETWSNKRSCSDTSDYVWFVSQWDSTRYKNHSFVYINPIWDNRRTHAYPFICKRHYKEPGEPDMYFPMDEHVGDTLIGPDVNATIYISSARQLIPGIQRGAIRVNPNPKSLTQEYVKIDSDANHTCFGSTTKCDEGFTMSLFVRINAHPSLNRSIASTDVLAVCIDSGIKQNRVGSYAVYLDSTRHLVVAMILAEKLYTYSVQHKFIEGQWHHLGLIFKTVEKPDVTILVDGVESMVTKTTANVTAADGISFDVFLGKFSDDSNKKGECVIDEWKIWFDPKNNTFLRDHFPNSAGECSCENNGICKTPVRDGEQTCLCQYRYYGHKCEQSRLCESAKDPNANGTTNEYGYCDHYGRTSYATQYHYIGCFKSLDSAGLPVMQTTHIIAELTPEVCMVKCKDTGNLYAGLKNGHLCMCGSSYGKDGPVEETDCSMPCAADGDRMCGGAEMISVYYAIDYVSGYFIRLGKCGEPTFATYAIASIQGCAAMCSNTTMCRAFDYSYSNAVKCALRENICDKSKLLQSFWSYLYIKDEPIPITTAEPTTIDITTETMTTEMFYLTTSVPQEACRMMRFDNCTLIDTSQFVGVTWDCDFGFQIQCETDAFNSSLKAICKCKYLRRTGQGGGGGVPTRTMSVTEPMRSSRRSTTTPSLSTTTVKVDTRSTSEKILDALGFTEADLSVTSLSIGSSTAMLFLIIPTVLIVLSDCVSLRRDFRTLRRNVRDFAETISFYIKKRRNHIQTLKQLSDLKDY